MKRFSLFSQDFYLGFEQSNNKKKVFVSETKTINLILYFTVENQTFEKKQ